MKRRKKNSAFELKSSEDINDLHLGSTIDDNCLTCGKSYKDCLDTTATIHLFSH